MSENKNTAGNFSDKVTGTPDFTGQFDQNDIASNKVMAVLAYIGILFLIPLFAAKKSRFARFHTNQGLVLFIFEIIWGVVFGIVDAILNRVPVVGGIIWVIGLVVNILFLALMIIGIVNAAQGKAKQLPLIGGITILK